MPLDWKVAELFRFEREISDRKETETQIIKIIKNFSDNIPIFQNRLLPENQSPLCKTYHQFYRHPILWDSEEISGLSTKNQRPSSEYKRGFAGAFFLPATVSWLFFLTQDVSFYITLFPN